MHQPSKVLNVLGLSIFFDSDLSCTLFSSTGNTNLTLFRREQHSIQETIFQVVFTTYKGRTSACRLCFTSNQDWVAQTSIKFKSHLSLKCKLISYVFKVNLSVS